MKIFRQLLETNWQRVEKVEDKKLKLRGFFLVLDLAVSHRFFLEKIYTILWSTNATLEGIHLQKVFNRGFFTN